MKYKCKSCKKECDDITKHLMTVHKFSKELIESQLKSNPNSYKNAFEKLKEWNLNVVQLTQTLNRIRKLRHKILNS